MPVNVSNLIVKIHQLVKRARVLAVANIYWRALCATHSFCVNPACSRNLQYISRLNTWWTLHMYFREDILHAPVINSDMVITLFKSLLHALPRNKSMKWLTVGKLISDAMLFADMTWQSLGTLPEVPSADAKSNFLLWISKSGTPCHDAAARKVVPLQRHDPREWLAANAAHLTPASHYLYSCRPAGVRFTDDSVEVLGWHPRHPHWQIFGIHNRTKHTPSRRLEILLCSLVCD